MSLVQRRHPNAQLERMSSDVMVAVPACMRRVMKHYGENVKPRRDFETTKPERFG